MTHNRWSSIFTIIELTVIAILLANFAMTQYWMPTFLGFESELPNIRESWLNASVFFFAAPVSIFFYWRLQKILLKELAF